MSGPKRLLEGQTAFFRALGETEGAPEGVRGRFEIYRYAYFERIRASIEEDYPALFAFLDGIADYPGGLGSERVTREILERTHPGSWTLAEAGLPIRESVDALLGAPKWADARAEAARLAGLDEAESLAAWVEEWPDPKCEKSAWVAAFASERLALVRTKTWRVSGDRVFWRAEEGVRTGPREEFEKYDALFPLVETPVRFPDFAARAGDVAEPALISLFIERGIGEGWLRFVP